MGKLFLKLWMLILLTSLTSYQIQLYVFTWSREDPRNAWASTSPDERFRRQFVMIEEYLLAYPQAEWPERFARLKERVGSPDILLGLLRLLTVDEFLKNSHHLQAKHEKVLQGKIVSYDLESGLGYDVYQMTQNSGFVMVLRAPFARQSPLKIFGVLSSLQFTWLVESSMYALAIFIWLRLFRRDMLTLEKAAGRVGEGYFDFDINIGKGAALYPLADSLNKMKERISSLISSHKQLTNAISHEFRTPITRLRFRHELALEATTLDSKDRELKNMDSAIDLLDELSTELLEYARLDRESPALDVSTIDVSAWLDELASEAKDVARTGDRNVVVHVLPSIESVEGDYRYLSRAASNLLRNAVRYANSRVEICVGQHVDGYVLTIDDDGPGIPLAERETLFEPFSRLDKSRDRATGGFGIGLAIVKQIARWHSGSVSITDAPIGGARLQIIWKGTSKVAV